MSSRKARSGSIAFRHRLHAGRRQARSGPGGLRRPRRRGAGGGKTALQSRSEALRGLDQLWQQLRQLDARQAALADKRDSQARALAAAHDALAAVALALPGSAAALDAAQQALQSARLAASAPRRCAPACGPTCPARSAARSSIRMPG